jgi:pimeloyl-ACP methyl ester carboxylesterase/protein-tyrosine phosphatase
MSTFEPKAWEAYTNEALVRLLAVVIGAHREEGQTVVLVGHSMGCSLAALLASSTSPHAHLLSQHVSGLIAICPQAEPPTEKQVKALKFITSTPSIIFDLFRRWDRRGGIDSKSVIRMTGPDAEKETKKLQLRFNKQSRTPVWQRMARGMCPEYWLYDGSPRGGLPGKEVWSGLNIPVFLTAGDADTVTPPSNVDLIVKSLRRDVTANQQPSEKASLPIAAAPFNPEAVLPGESSREDQDSGVDAKDIPGSEDDTKTIETTSVSTVNGSLVTTDGAMTDGSISNMTTPATTNPSLPPRKLVIKTNILPKPAAHSLLFASDTSRIVCGLIETFLAERIDPRLSLAWQLKYLTTDGKWDVKNLAKWTAVTPVSEPIAGVFRAMKTLREVDEVHTPKVLVERYKGELAAVIDISHDTPVYDPKGLEEVGIPYHKFATVSKTPPEVAEVKGFLALVDKIRAEGRSGLIGVHCHYGFNRTGFFLVSYLVERLGYKVEDAIQTFKTARPHGIKHAHFIDQLHVRYAQGLKRAPTL